RGARGRRSRWRTVAYHQGRCARGGPSQANCSPAAALHGRTWAAARGPLWHAAGGGGAEDAAVEVEAIARLVYDRLETMRAGRVLAVWPDGTVTEEGFGF